MINIIMEEFFLLIQIPLKYISHCLLDINFLEVKMKVEEYTHLREC